ncbi:MAG: hypothetical protein NTY64_21790 [Deltaproteobacteria bacterium]|nr:hypothetical protein [Deltaproteobacteria bacterium]
MSKNWAAALMAIVFSLFCGGIEAFCQEQGNAQKRILMERGEKVTGQRLKLVKKVIESYRGCQVLAEGNELKGLIIDGKEYQDFTLVIRDKKKTIIVVTADGVVTFDY